MPEFPKKEATANLTLENKFALICFVLMICEVTTHPRFEQNKITSIRCLAPPKISQGEIFALSEPPRLCSGRVEGLHLCFQSSFHFSFVFTFADTRAFIVLLFSARNCDLNLYPRPFSIHLNWDDCQALLF